MTIEMNKKDYHAPMHTAEHILNQTMVRKFGIDRSFSTHVERKKSKCDYHFDRDITSEEILDIEARVNSVINDNNSVTEEYVDLEKAKGVFNLSKLPNDVSPTIRIIRVGDYDICPCSGKHVMNTAEIGKFKIVSTTFDNQRLRLRFKLVDNQ